MGGGRSEEVASGGEWIGDSAPGVQKIEMENEDETPVKDPAK